MLEKSKPINQCPDWWWIFVPEANEIFVVGHPHSEIPFQAEVILQAQPPLYHRS